MMDFGFSGLDKAIAELQQLSRGIKGGLQKALVTYGEGLAVRFAGATPKRSGDAARGWLAEYRGILAGIQTVVVVNRVVSKRGFPYPSALLTGTGRRGAGATPTRGYTGRFSATPGMMPAANLQREWNDAASTSMASPAFLRGVFP